MPNSDPATELLRLMRQARTSRFSKTRLGGDFEQVTGEALVTTSESADMIVDLFETGRWSRGEGASFRFRNAYRWTRLGPTSLRLEQIRLGPQHPVHLLEFEPTAGPAPSWASVQDHLCRDDSYAAKLEIQTRRIMLRWTISGPRKNDQIESTYSLAQ